MRQLMQQQQGRRGTLTHKQVRLITAASLAVNHYEDAFILSQTKTTATYFRLIQSLVLKHACYDEQLGDGGDSRRVRGNSASSCLLTTIGGKQQIHTVQSFDCQLRGSTTPCTLGDNKAVAVGEKPVQRVLERV
jgi:hypothetical protein